MKQMSAKGQMLEIKLIRSNAILRVFDWVSIFRRNKLKTG